MTTRRLRTAAAATAALALLGAGCAPGGAATTPDQALENRFARGTVVEMRIDADTEGMSEQDARGLAQLQELQADSPLVAVGISPEGEPTSWNFADVVEVRWVTSDLYLRMDLARMAELGAMSEDAAPTPMPDPQDLADQLSAMIGGQQELTTALANGEWVGITDVSESLQGLVGDLGAMGGPMGLPSELPGDLASPPVDDEEAQALREEFGLSSFDEFLSTYATVEGDNPWQVTIDGAALRDALAEIEARTGATGAMGGDLEAIPDTIEGITVEADGEVATSISLELAALATLGDATDDDLARIADSGATLRLDLADWDEQAGAPADAVTVPMSELVASLGG